MSAVSVRIAVVPGSNTIGIEMPNSIREIVYLRDLLEADDFKGSKSSLTISLGKDIGGKNTYADLAKMPHLLVAGTTGSGKSVGVNSMIISLLYKMRPEECKLIMIDPKMLEFTMYNGIPHLLTPVITDPAKAVIGLKWAVKEMEDRYRAMAQLNVRNITGYNQRLEELRSTGEKIKRTVQTGFDMETGKPIFEEQELDLTPMPYIVIVVDEMADLMLVAGKDVEAAIQRLAQMARAAGIHLIMSTQRPSVDVITGTIKANFPSRISFHVTTKIDSRTIIGEQGAEQLLGMGDMLYMPSGLRPVRVHGCFVTDAEVEKVVEYIKSQGEPEYVSDVTEGELNTKDSGPVFDKGAINGANDDDDLYNQAVAIVRADKKASTSYIQRKLRLGYNRAAILIERMEDEGIVTAPDRVGRREVIGAD
jgi:S-DNA-T family DNA segregation ATPase FtsK/SpoIIIE